MLRFHVVNKRECQSIDHAAGPIEFGRGPKTNGVARCVIQDLSVSRNHVRVEELPSGCVRVQNLSEKNTVGVGDSGTLAPADFLELPPPLHLVLGETTVDVSMPPAEDEDDNIARNLLDTLGQPPIRPRSAPVGLASLRNLGEAPTPERLAYWFETLIAVQRAAAGSTEFYQQTAQALIDLVGLDKGLVLLRRGNRWEIAARAVLREEGFGRDFSTTVVRHAFEERRTLYQAHATMESSESLQGVEAVVASPIFDGRDNVVGVLYGSRNRYSKGRGVAVGELEAQVVQVLASVAGAGLARQEREADAARLRVQLEQVFSRDLASELLRNPAILEGQEREVTVLFSDIRGFSRLAQRLPPTEVCRLVAEVMECLTGHVCGQDGVVVDYYGDGLCAMWNAPFPQPDHAARACRAALAMMADLPQVSARWQDKLGGPLGVGVGVNTGKALVGNTGSRQKIKYGPFGHTVNLASRVEGATKQLGVAVLMTGTTYELVKEKFATRRLCRANLVGMAGAVDLYELHAEGAAPEWAARRDTYEEALTRYEAGEWAKTCQAVYPLLSGADGQYDVSCLNLVARAVDCLRSPPTAFDPTWSLASK